MSKKSDISFRNILKRNLKNDMITATSCISILHILDKADNPLPLPIVTV